VSVTFSGLDRPDVVTLEPDVSAARSDQMTIPPAPAQFHDLDDRTPVRGISMARDLVKATEVFSCPSALG
jgi:hypothetical protein